MSHLKNTCTNHSTPNVPLNVQDLSPKQCQSYLPTGPSATLVQFLSLIQQIKSQLWKDPKRKNMMTWHLSFVFSHIS